MGSEKRKYDSHTTFTNDQKHLNKFSHWPLWRSTHATEYLQNRSVRSLQECLHSACSARSPPVPPSASLFQASPTDLSLSAIRLQRRCLALLAELWASSLPRRAKDGRQTVTVQTGKEDLIRGRLGCRTWQKYLILLLPGALQKALTGRTKKKGGKKKGGETACHKTRGMRLNLWKSKLTAPFHTCY